MIFTLSPFFYYIANCTDITNFCIIESAGKEPYQLDKHVLEELLYQYIYNNSHGIDGKNIDKYVKYIGEQLAPNIWVK